MLTGDLSDFSLREILQFLATTSVSGVLQLRGDASPAGIALREGAICLALLDLRGIAGLAARLLHAGVVDVDQLRTLGERGGAHAVTRAAALATDLAADKAEAAAAAGIYVEHTYETLGWLARWDSASFQFQRSSDLGEWPFDTVTVGAALAEVDRRAADWDDLRETVSDLTLVASATPSPADIDEISLTPEQWRLISLVDGRRAVVDLIELSGVGHLQTCRQLDELVAAGLVELVEPGTASALSTLLDGLRAVGARGLPPVTASDQPVVAPMAGLTPSPLATSTPAPAQPHVAAPAVAAATVPPTPTAASVPTPTPVAAEHVAAPVADATPTGDANQDMLQRLLGGSGEGQ